MEVTNEFARKIILYIEDEPYNRLLVKKILGLHKIDVLEAEDGLSGLEIAQKQKVDLILLDINMEGMNGYEIATRLRSIEMTKETPLVALTANVLQRARDRSLISGCDGFITKPIDQETFIPLIHEYMNGRKDFVDSNKIEQLMKENNKELVYHLEKEIKELKRANDELKELDKLKSDFISLASHELRTPLVTIVGYTGLLLSKRLGDIAPNHEKILKIVDRNSKRLEKIVKDLFTLNMIDKDSDFLEKSEVAIPVLVTDVVEDLLLVFEERELTCNYHFEGEIPNVFCDDNKIAQVIDAVMGNAIKFTPNGGAIDIHVRYPSHNILRRFDLDAEKYVEIVIKDSGIGIPDNKLIKIFDKFVELGDIEKHHSSDVEFMGGGTGLGLSISKAVIEKHHGVIWAENRRSSQGAKFYIIIPIKSSYND